MFIQKIGVLGRTYRHIQRYREILRILFRYGFDDLVNTLRIEQYLDMGRDLFRGAERAKTDSLSRAERVRLVLEELGPTFIKLGQALSTRQDLLPADFIKELVKLQDEVPSFPFQEAREIAETELRGTLDEFFQHMEPVPLAAASIGQVHRARLKDGEDVAVKIQRPGIRRIVEADLEILFHLATLMEKHVEGWYVRRPTRIVEDFGRTMSKELDYTVEADHMERFAAQFLDEPRVYVPKIFRETTTSRILTMEYVEGIKSSSLDLLLEQGFDLKDIADRGAELLMAQIFVHGFFHADPHPGNLMILPGHVICFLDMGMMGRLDRTTRERIVDLVMSVVRRDESGLAEALLRITEWDDEPDRRELEKDATELAERHLYKPLHEMSVVRLMHQIFEIAARHKLRIPSDVLLLIKALSSLDGLGRALDPDFNLIRKAAPFVEGVQRDRYHPARLAQELFDQGEEMISFLRETPRRDPLGPAPGAGGETEDSV